MKSTYHAFKPKPRDLAYVHRSVRNQHMNRARTNWRKKMISGMTEGKDFGKKLRKALTQKRKLTPAELKAIKLEISKKSTPKSKKLPEGYDSTLGRTPRYGSRKQLAGLTGGDSRGRASASPTSRIPLARPPQQGRVVREELIERILNEITISNAGGSVSVSGGSKLGGGFGTRGHGAGRFGGPSGASRPSGTLGGGFGTSGTGSGRFSSVSTNSGRMSNSTYNRGSATPRGGGRRLGTPSMSRPAFRPSTRRSVGTPPAGRGGSPMGRRGGIYGGRTYRPGSRMWGGSR